MSKLRIMLATVLVSVLVAATYHYFELAVRQSIHYVWDTLFSTPTQRWLIVPLCLVLSGCFFAAQHYLDPRSEQQESEGLGEMPKPQLGAYFKVLAIGFLSLLAGVSLGPEAILVPASMVIGGYVGTKLLPENKQIVMLCAMIGLVALFTAFFNSFLAGMLGLLLAAKQAKHPIKTGVVVLSAIASVVTLFVLQLLGGRAYMQLPPYTWQVSVATAVTVVLLVATGFALTHILALIHGAGVRVAHLATKKQWWWRALLAAGVLSVLYVLGGSLVMFTGNESIVPLFQQAPELGIVGLIWILVIKLLAIGWSKAAGYRGGLIFPLVFVASVCVAISQTVTADINIMYGVIAVMIGAIAANKKLKILF